MLKDDKKCPCCGAPYKELCPECGRNGHCYQCEPVALWLVEGIGQLNPGERRKMKFGVMAFSKQDAIKKLLAVVREELSKPDSWVLEQLDVRQIPNDICVIVGMAGFSDGA